MIALELAKKELYFKGIIDKNLILFDPWFNKDNFKDLTSELDKFNLKDKSNSFKVHQFFCTPKKSFKFEYFFKPTTIKNLEKYEFQKKYQGLTYLINLINSKINLNIGNYNIF